MTSEELLDHHRRLHAELLASLEGLSDAQLQEPTIDGWSVKDNLAHLAFWDDLRADEITRISAGHASALHLDGGQDGRLNELAYQLRRGLSLDQVRWEIDHSFRRLEAAIQAAPSTALNPDLYGEAGLVSGHAGEHARYIVE